MTATISGNVSDNGSGLSDHKLIIINRRTGQSYEVTTDGDSNYSFECPDARPNDRIEVIIEDLQYAELVHVELDNTASVNVAKP